MPSLTAYPADHGEAEEGSSSPLAVLVADDDPHVLGLIRMCLPHHVITAAQSAADACTALRQAHFDVVITDVRMPDASGFDVVECATGAQPDAYLVAMSGAPRTALETCGSRQPDMVLAKPFLPRELRAIVDAARGFRRAPA